MPKIPTSIVYIGMSLLLHKIRDLNQRSLFSLLQRPSLLNPHYQHPSALVPSTSANDLTRCIEYFDNPTNRAHFDEAMAKQPRRLGHFAEYLIWYYLAHICQHACHHSIQINSPERSIGEFDLLFDDTQNQYWWEIAIKFYCFEATRPELEAWVGPNAKDNLGRKYQHLFHKQLQLDQDPNAQAKLHALGYTDYQAQALVKGYLFQPLEQNCAIDERINPECIYGTYLHKRELHLLPQLQKSARYLRVARHEWLAPVIREPRSNELMSHAHIISATKNRQDYDTHMLIALAPDDDGWWVEQQRILILADQWPLLS